MNSARGAAWEGSGRGGDGIRRHAAIDLRLEIGCNPDGA